MSLRFVPSYTIISLRNASEIRSLLVRRNVANVVSRSCVYYIHVALHVHMSIDSCNNLNCHW